MCLLNAKENVAKTLKKKTALKHKNVQLYQDKVNKKQLN